MVLAHHRPVWDLFESVGDIMLVYWFLLHVLWTHR